MGEKFGTDVLPLQQLSYYWIQGYMSVKFWEEDF